MKGTKADFDNFHKIQIIYALRIGLFNNKSETPTESLASVSVKESEFWNYEIIKTKFDFLDHYPSPPHPPEAPARAYSKILEAQELTSLSIKNGHSVVEIGSAPGGISYYLLNHEVSLTAIDPAEMDEDLTDKYPNTFKHLKMSIFDIERSHLPKNIDWVVSDLNLNGDLNVNQSFKVMNYYPKLKGAFLTLKTPNPNDLEKINDWKKVFIKKYRVEVMNLPSHKKEIGFVLRKKL